MKDKHNKNSNHHTHAFNSSEQRNEIAGRIHQASKILEHLKPGKVKKNTQTKQTPYTQYTNTHTPHTHIHTHTYTLSLSHAHTHTKQKSSHPRTQPTKMNGEVNLQEEFIGTELVSP